MQGIAIHDGAASLCKQPWLLLLLMPLRHLQLLLMEAAFSGMHGVCLPSVAAVAAPSLRLSPAWHTPYVYIGTMATQCDDSGGPFSLLRSTLPVFGKSDGHTPESE